MKITIIGAGQVGATLAQRVIENDLADVVLVDVIEGIPASAETNPAASSDEPVILVYTGNGHKLSFSD